MAAVEIAPLREARAKHLAATEAARVAKVEAEEARKAQREASRRRNEEAIGGEVQQKKPRYNPYLAHRTDEDDE